MSRQALRGNIALHWLTTDPSSLSAVTAAEITGGTDLLGTAGGEAARSADGWQKTVSTIDTPDLLSLVTGNIVGEVRLGEASITYYFDDTAVPIWDALTEGTAGFVVVAPNGDATGEDYEIFPAEVALRKNDLNSGNEANTWTVNFSIGTPTSGTLAA